MLFFCLLNIKSTITRIIRGTNVLSHVTMCLPVGPVCHPDHRPGLQLGLLLLAGRPREEEEERQGEKVRPPAGADSKVGKVVFKSFQGGEISIYGK